MSTERLISTQGIRCKLTSNGLVGIDQLLVSDTAESSNNYFDCFPSIDSSAVAGTLPFKDILYCSVLDDDVYEISYAQSHKNSIVTKKLMAQIEDPTRQFKFSSPTELCKIINDKAYENSQVSPSILILINPNGGQGKASRIFDEDIKPVLQAAHVSLEVMETKYSGHARDIAKDLDISKYDMIVCCSGDGIPHEVINGFYQHPDRGVAAFNKLAVTQLPCGSGNALSLSTHGTNDAKVATLRMLKSRRTKLDLMAVTQATDDGGELTSLSFCSQCYGAVADSDIGTEHLRWMGPIRFDLGVAHKVFTRARYPCDLYVKYQTQTKEELIDFFNENYENQKSKSLKVLTEDDFKLLAPKLTDKPPTDWIEVDDSIASNISIFYIGKVPMVSSDTQFFPAALPNDGSMDMIITDVNTPLMDSVKALLSVDKGRHIDYDGVLHNKISAYRLVPKLPEHSNHYISIDGENFPFRTMQVEVLPGILTGLLDNGLFVDTSLKK
ncbi:sphingoid long chain base kinase 4 [[Candida] jaroonii]|uniref:Sphingoid long chain base kinase 4 n=1 Tax=[Candida] jaroonii TaxID=467808 RepID=A0ACA9YDR5_9ASCO|nr:sphingoid long chain base kinase 4 [[Candida] jaroonii]